VITGDCLFLPEIGAFFAWLQSKAALKNFFQKGVTLRIRLALTYGFVVR
jgi:hypothetical protein